jgi:hypothetical protein
MKSTLMAALVALAVGASPVLAADKGSDDTDLQQLRSAVKQDKRAYVASVLALNEAEAKRFWPVYSLYQRTLEMADRRRARALIDVAGMDRPISDPYAKTLALELIAADEIEIKARRTLQNRLMRVLPARKAARYLQLESKIRAVEAYDVAASMPLVR